MVFKFLGKKDTPVPALELRIHGVHGTSPASMLGVEQSAAKQVAGDGLTGVFRSDKPLPLRQLNEGAAVEAYSWGALTSSVKGVFGWVQRALWMTLLPFALVNLAYWSRLHVGERERTGRWGATTVRWAGLLITMLFMLTVSMVAIDMVAWQCYRGGTKSCDVLPGVLDFMMRLAPSQRIALGMLVPLVGLVVLWFLSRQSLARYERCTDTTRVQSDDDGQLLRRSQFWSSTSRTQRLQRLHIVGAIATVMAFVGVQVDDRQHDADPRHALAGWWTIVAFIVLGFVLLALCFSQDGDVEHRKGEDAKLAGVFDILVWLALPVVPVLAVVQGFQLWHGDLPRDSRSWATDTVWLGDNVWFIALFLALTVLNIALFVAGRMKAIPATLIILAFAGGAFILAILSSSSVSIPERLQEFDVPGSLGLPATLGLVLALVFMVAMLIWQWFQRRNRHTEAWGGGGSAVLVGAAAWIALLFTTAIVTAAADYLNGSEQSVADLTAEYTTIEKKAMSDPPTGEHTDPVVDLGKDVVLRGAVFTVAADDVPDKRAPAPLLTRGTVETATAHIDADDPRRARKFSDVVLKGGSLILEDDTVELVDSCLRTTRAIKQKDEKKAAKIPDACQPESDGYVPRVSVKVPGHKIVVIAPGRHVRLQVDDPPQAPMVIPQVLIWTPIAQLVWALLVGAVFVLCLVRLRLSVHRKLKRQVEADRQVPSDSKPSAVRKRFLAALGHRAERILEFVGAVTVIVVLALLVVTFRGQPPWSNKHTEEGVFVDLSHPIATASLYAVLGLSAGLIALGSYFRRSESARKAVGVIWDLTTFWPRAAHPFSPPCYAERVVPELTTRIRWALQKDPTALVVVSGHSQGSLLAAATLIRLNDSELKRVRFITYGSQIRALYGRVFPGVFGDRVIGYRPTPTAPRFKDAFPDVTRCSTPGPPPLSPKGTLRSRVGEDHWFNLFRRTDPLGYRVFSDADSPWDVHVAEVPPSEAGDPGPPVLTHGGYQHTHEYRIKVGVWLQETIAPNEPASPGEFRPLPNP